MINVVRRSQIIGLLTMDGSTGSHLGSTEEVWLDERGRVTYLSGSSRYLPLEQVFVVGPDAILTYSSTLVDAPEPLLRLHQLAVESTLREPLGWIEDFLFDWQTGEIAAYILSGTIAGSSGNRVVLYPEDVEAIETEAVIIRESAKNQLLTEAEGLKGFLSEKSQSVRNLVKTIGDRLHGLISPEDKSQAVRIKIKQVSDELASSGKYEPDVLKEATEFLQERWESLQQSIARASSRAKAALDAAWKELTAK
ncbi:MAG: photosystem reaction center subunit H [Xenococcaceae cyanobacterium MO_167.B27]|nr:photosystem reaction center subunit H [Xenococcaceae cyanobacterium MO_167.B27]